MTFEEQIAVIRDAVGRDGSVGAPCVIVAWNSGRYSTIPLDASHNEALLRARVKNFKLIVPKRYMDNP